MTHKVIIEGVGKLAGNVLSGIALTPSVSLNRNIYSIESIDSIGGLNIPLKADWEHTEENIGSVVYTMGPNHSILYKIVVETDRMLQIKEGVHRVSIEAEVDEVASSCNKKGCYNLLDGITLTGIGVTENPGVQTTTLAITESYQSWPVIEGKHCATCSNRPDITKKENSPCVDDCIHTKQDNGMPISTETVDICNNQCGGNESVDESEEVKVEIENLKREIEILKMPHCSTCNKVKTEKKLKIECDKCHKFKEEEDDTEWITVNGNHIPVKAGQSKDDAVNDFIATKGKSGDKKDYTKKDIDTTAKKLWNGYTQKQKVNHYSTYAGKTKPGQSHYVNKVVGNMTFDELPKYAKQSLKDDAEDVLKRNS